MNKIITKMAKMGSTVYANDELIICNYCAVKLYDKFDCDYDKPSIVLLNGIQNLFEDARVFDIELEVPTVKEIKEEIKSLCGYKRKVTIKYCFGENLPNVNARYMLDLIENLQVTQILYKPSSAYSHPLFFKGKLGEALLLPIRTVSKSGKSEKEKQGYKII